MPKHYLTNRMGLHRKVRNHEGLIILGVKVHPALYISAHTNPLFGPVFNDG